MVATCSKFAEAPVIAAAKCPALTIDEKKTLAEKLKNDPHMYEKAIRTNHDDAVASAKEAQTKCFALAANKDYPCACKAEADAYTLAQETYATWTCDRKEAADGAVIIIICCVVAVCILGGCLYYFCHHKKKNQKGEDVAMEAEGEMDAIMGF
jgi:hypothetical protein